MLNTLQKLQNCYRWCIFTLNLYFNQCYVILTHFDLFLNEIWIKGGYILMKNIKKHDFNHVLSSVMLWYIIVSNMISIINMLISMIITADTFTFHHNTFICISADGKSRRNVSIIDNKPLKSCWTHYRSSRTVINDVFSH